MVESKDMFAYEMKKDNSLYPFSYDLMNDILEEGVEEYSFLEIQSRDRFCFNMIQTFVQENLIEHHKSHRIGSKSVDKSIEPDENGEYKAGTHTQMKIGYGKYKFAWNGKEMICVNQKIGEPVGSNCGIGFFTNMILFIHERFGTELEIQQFCDHLIRKNSVIRPNSFRVYSWSTKSQYWSCSETKIARSLDSVILPEDVKTKFINDIDDFESEETKDFYHKHGIPYRRSYLFYGKAGMGKSSLIQAVAGKYSRNVCFLQPTHPQMTDDSLKQAISETPSKSIIVLEDVDALFDENREPLTKNSCLTFSGLLNALDGLGSRDGQIICLTTNFRDRLDHALIRQGRVDLHVRFDYMSKEQIGSMFLNFYPKSQLSDQFVDATWNALEKANFQLTGAGLQHFFVCNRKATDRQCVENVDEIIDELQTRVIEEKEKQEAKKKKGDENEDDSKLKSKALSKSTENSNSPPSSNNPKCEFHLHLSTER